MWKKFDARLYFKIFQHSLHSQSLFGTIQHVHLECDNWNLPLGSTLNRRGLKVGTRFFCIVQLEDNTHWFIQFRIALCIWKYHKNHGRYSLLIVLCRDNGSSTNMGKMNLKMRWKSYSNFYDIGGCNIMGIYIMSSCW